jgi:RimJ/RimL family protein N-acetyltransferase
MRLIPLTRERAQSLAGGDFSSLQCSNLDEANETLRGVARAYVEFYDRVAPTPPWIGYLAVDEETGNVVGSCGYKGDCSDGMVEIAYFSFPGHEGRGVATEMARLLIELAWREREVQIVRAHTLREENASVRILRRLGFALIGTVEDPEDGPVWRWDLGQP